MEILGSSIAVPLGVFVSVALATTDQAVALRCTTQGRQPGRVAHLPS